MQDTISDILWQMYKFLVENIEKENSIKKNFYIDFIYKSLFLFWILFQKYY